MCVCVLLLSSGNKCNTCRSLHLFVLQNGICERDHVQWVSVLAEWAESVNHEPLSSDKIKSHLGDILNNDAKDTYPSISFTFTKLNRADFYYCTLNP